ncbi:MAG: DUF2892 domain-containing protein [Candidatus Shapirobacteria bacterium]|jgi:hypothetical protein
MFTQNESKLDKNIRLGIGALALLLGIFIFTGTFQIVTLIIAALAIFTGLTGFCLLYKIFGIKTTK